MNTADLGAGLPTVPTVPTLDEQIACLKNSPSTPLIDATLRSLQRLAKVEKAASDAERWLTNYHLYTAMPSQQRVGLLLVIEALRLALAGEG